MVAATACGSSDNEASGSDGSNGPTELVDGGAVDVRLTADWTNFDVQRLPSVANVQLVLPAYDRLIDFDGEKLVPYVAESWTESPDEAVFTLRDGVTCADGSPVTATVVANSFKRLVDPATKFTNRVQLFGSGAVTITPDDAAKTVTFAVDQPFSNLIYAFADPSSSIICPAGLADPALLETQMFGSGPYTLESAVHNDRVVFKLRDDWKWGPYGMTSATPGMPATITYRIVPDESTAANLLKTGELNLASVTGPDVERLVADKELTHQEVPYSTSALMVFNQSAGHVTQDQKVRQALTTAIDPEVWRKVANGGYGIHTTSYMAPTVPCFEPATADLLPEPDVDAARQVLLDDGWTYDGGVLSKDGKALSLSVLGTTSQNSGPDYLTAQFKEMGANVELTKVDFATYAKNLNSTDFSWDVTVAQLGSINAFAALPSTFAVPYMSGKVVADGGRNLYHIIDPGIEADVAKALSTTGDESCQAWSSLQKRYLTRSDFLPLGVPVDNWFSRNVEFQPMPIQPLTWRVVQGGS